MAVRNPARQTSKKEKLQIMFTELRFPCKKVIAFALMIVMAMSSVVTVVATTVSATIHDGDKSYTVQVMSPETDEILKQANVQTGANDIVTRDEKNGIVITVKRGYFTDVKHDGKETRVLTHTGDTVADALAEAKVYPSATDIVSPALTSKLADGVNVNVIKQFNVTVQTEINQVNALVAEGTAEDAVRRAGISLGDDDLVEPSRTAPVTEGMIINVKRVIYRETVSKEAIEYDIVEQKDNSMLQGKSRVTTPGEDGEQTVTAREMLVDGVVTERQVLNTVVIKEPVDEVALVGTMRDPSSPAPEGTFIDKDGKVVPYRSVIKGKCSAYTSNGGYTSTGQKARYGLVAVDPDIIPYGTKLYIASPDGKTVYGYAIAADTGGAMLSGRILADLYYDTNKQCYNFGIRNMNVYIL